MTSGASTGTTTADRPALLMVAMEPPAALEDEFNDWYDTEHLPQRLALPGFVAGSRWVCIHGWPRWLALYDLTSEAAVGSDAYRGVSGAQSTPWSRRILPRTVGRSRVAAVALDGAPYSVQLEPDRTSRLLVMGVALRPGGPPPHAMVDAVRQALSQRDGVLQQRAFVEVGTALWLLVAFDAPVSSAALAEDIGRPCGAGATTFNLYLPYQRGRP
jgi:hypothetical protein